MSDILLYVLILHCVLCWLCEAYSFYEDFADTEKEFKEIVGRSSISYILPMWAIVLLATICWMLNIFIAPVTVPMRIYRYAKLYFVMWGVKRMLIKEGIMTKQEWQDLMDGKKVERFKSKKVKP